ncbi:MAG: HD domain-containing protein [Planctomycetota bacterium]|nr:HD domain-containing protein [Planctomycetota bacterium]
MKQVFNVFFSTKCELFREIAILWEAPWECSFYRAKSSKPMDKKKLRRQIAWEAARLMYERSESEYYRTKMKAARKICKGWVKPSDLPGNAEIRDEIQLFARLHEGETRVSNLRTMRLEALQFMQFFSEFKPRLIGSVLTGHIRKGSDVDIHLFTDSLEAITCRLEERGLLYDVERKQVRKDGESVVYTHVHVRGEFPVELTLYPYNRAHHVFKSSITGKAMERASLNELKQFLLREYPEMDLEAELEGLADRVDRFQYFESLLYPLENVKQDSRYHPEGDALYHSLQVFDLGVDVHPYDEEFLLAALLHDVGKAIDPADHVTAGLEALEGFVSERTGWLIEHHMDCHRIRDQSIGARAHRRLRVNENYAELIELGEIDRAGRGRGVQTSSVEEAIDYLRSLEGVFG